MSQEKIEKHDSCLLEVPSNIIDQSSNLPCVGLGLVRGAKNSLQPQDNKWYDVIADGYLFTFGPEVVPVYKGDKFRATNIQYKDKKVVSFSWEIDRKAS